MLNRRIEFLISAVEQGSFSAAAKQFLLSQSAVSQQITQLERELGVVLFERGGYRPVLTKAGEYYYRECKSLMEQYSEIERITREIAGEEKRLLRIGITGPLESKVLPRVIPAFRRQYPDVQVQLKKIRFEAGVRLLESGELDLSFGISNDFKNRDNLEKTTLMKHHICVICSPNHAWAKRKSVESSEIAGQPIISLSRNAGSLFYTDFMEAFRKDRVIPNIVQECDELEELILAVKMNQGIALTSREVVDGEDGVCMLEVEHSHHGAEFCVGYLKTTTKEYARTFAQMTKALFSGET